MKQYLRSQIEAYYDPAQGQYIVKHRISSVVLFHSAVQQEAEDWLRVNLVIPQATLNLMPKVIMEAVARGFGRRIRKLV